MLLGCCSSQARSEGYNLETIFSRSTPFSADVYFLVMGIVKLVNAYFYNQTALDFMASRSLMATGISLFLEVIPKHGKKMWFL